MPSQFYIAPAAGIFRAVTPGNNAQSPSSPSVVTFNGFGPPYQGVFMAGQVLSSTFGSTAETPPPGAASWTRYSTTIAFGKTFANPPQLLWLCQDPSTGGWTPQYQINLINYSGPTGSWLGAWGSTSTTGLTLGYDYVKFSAPVVISGPSVFSYRVFQV
jgi:hypothetical protein